MCFQQDSAFLWVFCTLGNIPRTTVVPLLSRYSIYCQVTTYSTQLKVCLERYLIMFIWSRQRSCISTWMVISIAKLNVQRYKHLTEFCLLFQSCCTLSFFPGKTSILLQVQDCTNLIWQHYLSYHITRLIMPYYKIYSAS